MKINAIDTHCHIHYTPVETLAPITLSDVMQEGPYYTAYWNTLSQIEKAAKISTVFASPFEALTDRANTVQANEDMFKLVQDIPNLYQWVVIDPQNESTFEQADRMLKSKKCVGIKLHPVLHKYSIEEQGEKIFSFAEKHSAIVQIHPEKAADYITFADSFPNVTFIIAHLGGPLHINAIKNAKHRNVYTDTSGKASLKNMLIEYAVSQIGSDRILFGTDTYAASSQRGRIEYAMISQQDKENILFNNAKRLFGL
ncbi:MAG: amidohydrolase family protein [Lachnospiraceae bacterium]|nr:amidohydrolase family protein [Lachnospiraceae bacterium]